MTRIALLLCLLLAGTARADNVVMVGFGATSCTPSANAWASVGSLATAANGTAGTTWAPTTSATLEAGNVAVCVVGKDETGTGTTDGTGNNQFTSITDTASNTWVEAYEWCNMQTSTAANGACTAVYYTRATTQLNSGQALTLTFSASTTRKALACWEYTASSGNLLSVAAGANGLANDAADPGSMTDATGVSKEHLFIRSSACESNSTAYTVDSDYTTFTHTSSTSDSGTAATSMGVRGEFRIATESTSAASDPSYVAADCASAMVGLDLAIQQCADCVDNDSDSAIDYPADSGCADANGNSESTLAIVKTCQIAEDDDSNDCAFSGNVTSGNTIVCVMTNESAGTNNTSMSIAGSATVGSWATECDADNASVGNVEIKSASVTGTGTLTATADWSASAGFDSAAFCYEFSGASDVVGFTSDVDSDNPQAESYTVAANDSYVVGGMSDWNAIADTEAFISTPAQTEVFADETGGGSTYTAYFYRTTNTVSAGAQNFGFATHASNAVGHCAAEVKP